MEAVEAFVVIGIIVITLIYNISLMIWFLVSYRSLIHAFNLSKIICLVLENAYLFLMIATFSCQQASSDILCWLKKLVLSSFAGLVLEILVSYIITGRVGITFVKDAPIDPVLLVYYKMWEKLYL